MAFRVAHYCTTLTTDMKTIARHDENMLVGQCVKDSPSLYPPQGDYSTQSWVSTVKLIEKEVAVNLHTEGAVRIP